jgi:hypothetical protein
MEENLTTYNILSQSAFWQVNKYLAKLFKSNDCALLLSDLITKQGYFLSQNQLTEDGYFFNTRENIENDCNISPYEQRKHLKTLKDFGVIEMKEMGLPKKTYYKVNEDKVLELVINNKSLKNLTTGGENFLPPEVKKFNINNNKEIKIKNKNKLIKQKVNYFEKFKEDKELGEWCDSYSKGIGKRCIRTIELHEELKKMTDWVDSKNKVHANPLRFAKNWLQKKLDNLPVSISLSTSQPTYTPNLQEINPDYEPPQTYRRGGMQSISNLLNF